MSSSVLAELRDALLDPQRFVRAQCTDPGPSPLHPWRKILIRPVQLKAGYRWQVSRFDAKKDLTKNYDASQMPAVVDELLGLGFRSVVVEAATATYRLGKGGKVAVVAHEAPRPVEVEAHNRRKNTILDPDHPVAFLGMLGFLTAEGKLRADKRDKFTQINEFLRLLDETDSFPERGQRYSVVDFGCGNAYLTFALYHHLVNNLGLDARVTGVDLKEDLIAAHRERVKTLGWEGLTFETGTIQAFTADRPPDAIVALHACDTATDDAIAQGLAWNAQMIVVAPCCHHHLQAQLARVAPPAALAPVMRYGLTSERQGDLLTDAFRGLLLRIEGYKTDMVQFVDGTHTPKNLMIRAVKTPTPAPASFRSEYETMKAFWQVTPYLEGKLPRRLEPQGRSVAQ